MSKAAHDISSAPAPAAELESYWMPFTGNRYFKSHPRLITSAQGMYVTSTDGRQLLDTISGMWCCNLGHSHPRLVEAVKAQLDQLDYATAFQLGHPGAFELAAGLCELAPEGFNHAFFVNSGSESVDTALKMALAYHRINGEASRTRLVGREKGYHGVGFGGISVGGMMPNRKMFGAMLPGVDHLPHTHHPEHNAFSRGQPAWGAHLADALEDLVALHDASNIAAVIVEPVAGSVGVLVPPVGYLQRLREICDRHGILLIFDEVITAFGRTGAAFGADTLGVVPDIITTAKGLTSGMVPMGAVLVRDEIYNAFMQGPPDAIEFFHGYTYSGHPVATAAGLAALSVYAEDDLFNRAAALGPVLEDHLHGLKDAPHVIDVRNLGLMGAVELEPRDGAPGARGLELFRHCFDREDLLIRVTGDTVAFGPSLIVSEQQLAQMAEGLARGLGTVS